VAYLWWIDRKMRVSGVLWGSLAGLGIGCSLGLAESLVVSMDRQQSLGEEMIDAENHASVHGLMGHMDEAILLAGQIKTDADSNLNHKD